jgi:hypothetical protein
LDLDRAESSGLLMPVSTISANASSELINTAPWANEQVFLHGHHRAAVGDISVTAAPVH